MSKKDINRVISIILVMNILMSFLHAEEQPELPVLDSIDIVFADTDKYVAQDTRNQGWAFSFDNDLLVPSSRDQDYTFGVSVNKSSEFKPDLLWSVDSPLQWVNSITGITALQAKARSFTTEIGIYAFTPEEISNHNIDESDRPYSSLIYVSNSREYQGSRADLVWRSTLTLGALGLRLAGDLQNEVHSVVGSDHAEGWDKQISNGGEFTARYSVSRQRLWTVENSRFEIKTSTQASLGYITELSYGASIRLGNIVTRWQSFNPELATYREHSVPVLLGKGYEESYFSAGVAIKARAYNAFLQGQFRDSEHTFSSNQLNHGVFEAWAGYTHIFRNGYRLNYTLRGHTSEIKDGIGDRTALWGGLSLARNF